MPGKVSRQLMYQAARRKNLSGLPAAAFDPYVERLLVGNPLTAPLEEINPMQLTESARRITKMGPGGLGSSDLLPRRLRQYTLLNSDIYLLSKDLSLSEPVSMFVWLGELS